MPATFDSRHRRAVKRGNVDTTYKLLFGCPETDQPEDWIRLVSNLYEIISDQNIMNSIRARDVAAAVVISQPDSNQSDLGQSDTADTVIVVDVKPVSHCKQLQLIETAMAISHMADNFLLSRDFDKLQQGLMTLHQEARHLLVAQLVADQLLTEDQFLILFDEGLITQPASLKRLFKSPTMMSQLFDSNRWSRLAQLLSCQHMLDVLAGGCDTGRRNRHYIKSRKLLLDYLMQQWQMGSVALSAILVGCRDEDVDYVYGRYRKDILIHSNLLSDSEWQLFLSHHSNVSLLVDCKDAIPVPVRIQALIYHKMDKVLCEDYNDSVEMELILTHMMDFKLTDTGFWFRFMSRQLWQLQRSVMGRFA